MVRIIIVRLMFIPVAVSTFVFTALTASPIALIVPASRRPAVIRQVMGRGIRLETVDAAPVEAPEVAAAEPLIWPVEAIDTFWVIIKRYMTYAFTFKHREVEGTFYGFQYQYGY